MMLKLADALEAVTVPTENPTEEGLAEVIWHTSREDEGTISVTGANIVAKAILARFRLPVPVEPDRERLDAIYALLSSLDLDGPTTREGTAWGSILREAKELSAEAPEGGTQ
jgi:hypothetical protein